MTDCVETLQNLHLYVGGELEPSQTSTAQRHLAGCASCRAALDVAERARELYWSASVDSDAESLDLWPGIRSRLVSEGRLAAVNAPRTEAGAAGSNASPRTPSQSPPRSGIAWVFGGLAAAAAALFVYALAFPFDEPASSTGTPIATPVRPLPTFVGQPLGDDTAVVAGDAVGLRPVLQGEESLIERAWREQLERAATGESPFQPNQGAYEVVNGRQLR